MNEGVQKTPELQALDLVFLGLPPFRPEPAFRQQQTTPHLQRPGQRGHHHIGPVAHQIVGRVTPEGEFLELPEFDLDRLQAAWQEAVFSLYLAEDKIEPEVVDNMRTWPHSGFSVDQSVLLPAHDRPGIERLAQYMTRCPFSLSRLVQVTKTGQVIYKGEKDACRAFPEPQGDGLATGPKRNFQILAPLDFLAEFTQHIPPEGAHLIRYYGWYSNKARGMRQKAAAEQRERIRRLLKRGYLRSSGRLTCFGPTHRRALGGTGSTHLPKLDLALGATRPAEMVKGSARSDFALCPTRRQSARR